MYVAWSSLAALTACQLVLFLLWTRSSWLRTMYEDRRLLFSCGQLSRLKYEMHV